MRDEPVVYLYVLGACAFHVHAALDGLGMVWRAHKQCFDQLGRRKPASTPSERHLELKHGGRQAVMPTNPAQI